jgi:hypothetical protein
MGRFHGIVTGELKRDGRRYTSAVTLADKINLGTCAFTAPGWAGSFYPQGMKPEERLTFYAEHFDTVEVDSTFYGTPSPHTVSEWAQRTPENFIFSLKVPQIITHENVLVGCDDVFDLFVDTAGRVRLPIPRTLPARTYPSRLSGRPLVG